MVAAADADCQEEEGSRQQREPNHRSQLTSSVISVRRMEPSELLVVAQHSVQTFLRFTIDALWIPVPGQTVRLGEPAALALGLVVTRDVGGDVQNPGPGPGPAHHN